MKHPPTFHHLVSSEGVLSGEPRIENTRVSIECLVGRFAAGDSMLTLCREYALTSEQVTEAIRAVCAAAYGQRGMFENVRRELIASVPVQLS